MIISESLVGPHKLDGFYFVDNPERTWDDWR